MWISLLGLSFFVLSSDYKKSMLQEIYYLCRHVNMTYTDGMTMPTYERKFFVNMLIEEFNKKNEQIEKQNNKIRR